MKHYIGIDLGGTSIKGGVVSGNLIIKEQSVETCAQEGGEQTLTQLYKLIDELLTPQTVAIGIGVPSVVDRVNGIVYDVQNIKDWNRVALRELVESRFGLPVSIDNDANCFAVGEKQFGAGQAFNHFVGITLGTGVGGGIIQNGKLLQDANCGSGEFGELPYKDSIVEAYCASGYFARKGMGTGAEVAEKARQGDPVCMAIFHEFGLHLAALVKMIVLTIDPQAILIGGSISHSFPLFQESLHQALKEFPYQNSLKNLTIAPSTLQNSGILGAAALCL
ncbi:MAG: ROK family protein [Phocaeicola sp.]